MKGHAVLEASGDRVGLQIADFRHPEAVERLLGRVERGGDLPLLACCAEDLEAVRRHVTGTTNPEHTLRLPALPIAVEEGRQKPTSSRQRHSATVPAEQEHASMKFLGVLALVFLIVAILWQLGLWGVTAAYTSYAADEAAHAARAGGTTAEVRDDALRSVPSWFRTNIDVSQTDLGTVKATSSMPVLTPIFTVDGLDLTSEAPIVTEGS
jgi:hypothetical protein